MRNQKNETKPKSYFHQNRNVFENDVSKTNFCHPQHILKTRIWRFVLEKHSIWFRCLPKPFEKPTKCSFRKQSSWALGIIICFWQNAVKCIDFTHFTLIVAEFKYLAAVQNNLQGFSSYFSQSFRQSFLIWILFSSAFNPHSHSVFILKL